MKNQLIQKMGIAATITLTAGTVMAGWTSSNFMGTTTYRSNSGLRNIKSNNFMGTTYYRSNSGQTGTSSTFMGTTSYRGSLFRGSGKAIFENKEIAKRFDVVTWIDATLSKDVNKMTQSAWQLKGIEKALGKQDKKLTSKSMFETAARIAIIQNNAQALKEIVALEPACKKYQEELKLSGKTRGNGIGSIVNMPEMVIMPGVAPKNWLPKLGNLKPYQQPRYSMELLGAQFRGISPSLAGNISFLVNRGRTTLDPTMLATGAIQLAKIKMDKKTPSCFMPKLILGEAAGMAMDLGDKDALDFITGLYQTSILKNAVKAKKLQEEAKLMGKTRGVLYRNMFGDLRESGNMFFVRKRGTY